MKRHLILILLAVFGLEAAAQDFEKLEFPDEYLDTVVVKRDQQINNYNMVSFKYGVSFSNMDFSPSRHNRGFVFKPNYMSLMFTHYEKLFDYLPYFGVSAGIAYGHEGVTFKKDKVTGKPMNYVDYADYLSMEVIEAPALAEFHVDVDPAKLMACVGVYGGYRLSIERTGEFLEPQFTNSWHPYEHRWDYGMQGGAGIGLMFDPVEINIGAMVRWSWSTLYDEDYNSTYYYRFAYPIDIMVTVGFAFHLSKRTGKTSAQLKKEAYDIVYGKTENP